MGIPKSKLHPRNAELIKFKKKYDTSSIKKKEPVHIWVIGPVTEAASDLADLIADKHGYMAICEKRLLEAEASTDSERGHIVKAILDDNMLVCAGIVEDLVIETLLARMPGLKGVVFSDLPRCKCDEKVLKKIVGPVSLVIYMHWSETGLKAALDAESDEKAFTKRIETFNKHTLPLGSHKKSFTVEGDQGPAACMAACSDVVSRVSLAGC